MTAIGICDDSILFQEELRQFVLTYEKEHHQECEIRLFSSAKELLAALDRGESLEILFLDIEMPQMNGIELGKRLREMICQMLIIYVSGYEKYLRQLFEIEPFGFCGKPLDREELNRVLDRATERILSGQNEMFRFQYGKNVANLRCADIIYMESSGRKVIIHTPQTEYQYYDKLDEAEERLPKGRFVRIHKAYLINMDYVEAFQYEKVAMRDGTILNISEKNRTRVRSQFWDYLKEKENG